MAFVPGFEHDIFISYSHVDDQDGWVELFQKHLEVELSRLVGRVGVADVWRDRRRLQGNHLFDQTIQDAINTSALFIALTSNGYLKSDYCQQELRWFREKNGDTVKIGDKLRLFNALLTNIHHTKWPPDYAGTSGNSFHDAERDDQIGYPSDPNEKLFRAQMRQLCEAVHATLEAFKHSLAAQNGSPPTQPVKTANKPFTIFLADTNDTLATQRTRLSNELILSGDETRAIQIIEPIPPPFESGPHDGKVIAALGGAQLSVHLLNQWPGRKMDGAMGQTYPQRQVELAQQHASAQLVWVPAALDSSAIQQIEDPAQREFLRQLDNSVRDRARFRFVRGPETELKDLILEWLAEQQSTAAPSANASALLANDPKDNLHAFELGHILEEHRLPTHLYPEVPDPNLRMKLWEELVKQVNKLVIVFGKSEEEWVRKRLEDAVQIAINQRRPLDTLAVCFAPPRRKEDGVSFDWKFFQVHHFNLDEARNPETLSRLLGNR